MFDIKEQLKKLPEKPGVYIMKDENSEIIYIGKAINLKNRVRQYFQSSKNHTPKVLAMVSRISEFEFIITDSELEALILECNLIKKHKPKYNILLKDDKNYPYIKITINEEYPRVMLTRKVEKDGAKYFGPYSSSGYVNDTLEVIRKLFPLATCNRVFPRDIGKGRPCLYYFIGQCIGTCTGRVSKEQYDEVVKDVILFLEGKHDLIVKRLQEEMLEASKNLNFEKAAQLRDKINSITHINERQKIISTAMEDQDVIAFASGEDNTAIQIFFIRGGKLIGREKYILDGTEETPRQEILCEFLKQFYAVSEFVPREVLLQEEIDEVNIIESWLSSKRGSKVHIRVPKKGEKHQLVDMVYKNALKTLEDFESKVRSARDSEQKLLEEIRDVLGLDNIPSRLEAYDISNISGSLSVGSMVVFTGGKPDKHQYRKFKINSVKGPNDYMSMQEVLFRRFRDNEKFPDMPDLLMIDGGKGHVNAVLEVLKELNVNIPVCGMVKDDKHRTRGLVYDNKEIDISKKPKLFKLITQIQDEVHRFAISYHKLLREKQLKKSVLDDIKGVGEKRKAALMKHFKSIENIKKASLDELENIEGMNKASAKVVYEFFGGKSKED